MSSSLKAPTSGTSAREKIRLDLASSGQTGKEKSLQLCFLNEAVFEEEEDEEKDEKADSVSSLPLSQRPSALFIAKNNISKKKNHVIIPLTPNSAKAKQIKEETEEENKRPQSDIRNLTEDTFALYLKEIRTEAREKLKEVRNKQTEEGVDGGGEGQSRQHAKCFIQDLERLFGLKGGRKFSRHALTGMNTAQLQVILNFLLSRIEELNEKLVQYLISRDELVMEQDSLLTDVEDITKGIGCL